ncbi:MAG TPA: hypothetical protein VN366_05900 [Feifaniaceae bacterium]|nr:hypothetical protein [Feifaniaceae bacterium]
MFKYQIQKNEWIGIGEAQEKPRRLRAGKLAVDFASGRIVNVSMCGKTLIDEIYFALRDRNWGTIPYRLEALAVTERADSFAVSFTAVHDRNDIRFTWEGKITGSSDSKITYAFDGVANSDFMRNRIGFCVLHPASCGGVECEVEHFGGETEKGIFPAEISPDQPFYDIKSLTHYPEKGIAVRVDFEGDVFEMEDQRNWTDASFKTYCTPLKQPFPAPVKNGGRYHQTVTVSLQANAEPASAAPAGGEAVSPAMEDARDGSGFSLGSCITRPLTALQLERVRALELSHLRYDYHLDGSSEYTEEIFKQAHALGVGIVLAVFFTRGWEKELETLSGLVRRHRSGIKNIAVFQQDVNVPQEELLAAVRKALVCYSIPVGSGTDAFFTQINRERLPGGSMDFVTYSNNPQVHAFDNESIMSTVEGQAANLFSCERLYPHLPVWVSPVTLRMRWNPDATGKEPVKKGQAPRDVEPRQMSLFAASWFLRSVAACVRGGAAGATYFELTGGKGIMEEAAPHRDYRFPAAPDMLFPLYYAFFALRGLETFKISAAVTPDVTRIVLRNDGGTRLILANPGSEAVDVPLADTVHSVRGIMLDEDNVQEMAQRRAVSTEDGCYQTYNLNGKIQLKRYSIFIAEF